MRPGYWAATAYVGDYFEWTTGGAAPVTYYYAGGQRVALWQGADPLYLLGDHLGSAYATVNSAGWKLNELRYEAYGETRYASGSLPTARRYTGQSSFETTTGLYFYNARWYDGYLTQFSQPDTIVPDQYNILDWNRYQYARANPLRFNDPSGHIACEEITSTGRCIADGVKISDVPNIPSSPPGGDHSTPWEVGVEWVTGYGPRNHEFRDGDPFTELLKEHSFLDYLRKLTRINLVDGDFSGGVYHYDLSGIEGIPKYFKDYSTLVTLGKTGNLAVTYLGGYRVEIYVTDVNFSTSVAEVTIHISNSSTLGSGIRPPVVGYTDFWNQKVAPLINPSTGPMSKVTQSFWWTEKISFK